MRLHTFSVEVLRVAVGDGRLTADELDERLEHALTARTFGELAVLIRDLPAAPGFGTAEPAAAPKDLARIDCQSSTATRDGRWLVPQRLELLARQRQRDAGLHRGGALPAVAPDQCRYA